MRKRRPEPVEIVDYDPGWPAEYERIAERVRRVAGLTVLRIEHVGSTAVRGLAAKPVIDVLVVIPSGRELPAVIEALEPVGYRYEDERHPGLHAFRWPAGEPRHHLYVCAADAEELRKMVAFRDQLAGNPQEAVAYADLKRTLAERHRHDRQAYTDAKTEYVERVTRDGRASLE